MNTAKIILASSSQTRKELMNRLRLDYVSIVPDIDESPQGENHADDLAKRLAFEKPDMWLSNTQMQSSLALTRWLGVKAHQIFLSASP